MTPLAEDIAIALALVAIWHVPVVHRLCERVGEKIDKALGFIDRNPEAGTGR